MLSDDELLRLYHGDDQHGHIRMDGAHGDGLRRVSEKARRDALEDAARVADSEYNKAGRSQYVEGWQDAADIIAQGIRSLIPTPVTPTNHE